MKLVFDQQPAKEVTEARIKFLQPRLPSFMKSVGLKTALDAGCGVGYFSRYLAELGLDVTAFDASVDSPDPLQNQCALGGFVLQKAK